MQPPNNVAENRFLCAQQEVLFECKKVILVPGNRFNKQRRIRTIIKMFWAARFNSYV